MDKDRPKVQPGKIITVIFKDQPEPVSVCILDKKPALNADIKCISLRAPLSQAILDHMEGDEVEFTTAVGKLTVEIARISSQVDIT